MALTVKRVMAFGRTAAVVWTDAGGAMRSIALDVGDDAEILARLGNDTVILPADPPVVKKSAILQTTVEDFRTNNNTITTMVSWPLAQQTLYAARFTVTAIDTVNADCRTWFATASAKRVNAGALLVGTPTIVDSDPDTGASGWGLAADVSGNDFRVRVTGAAGRTISWCLIGEVMRARPDGLVD